jgi:hypothetical protein
VNNLEVDEPRPAGFVVIDHVVGPGIAVRPQAVQLIAPELMSAAEFVAGRFDHLPGECALL